ncbi:hypothetical protein FY034_18610 (plasmid) [Trichlorobacter lovleyi]|uniref:hypothetical protein n=1 Tax=Trichlorobacter lovleyi TaxID=313985 RepID=UPI0022403CEF|nr:hypothetical protein [Trichlorobacter lovleyi]QOX80999.1 hypothetical protein FY034_18610 [Trichlorobacter lovleyi]
MKPSLKYWIFILGMACAIFGDILASVLGSWLNLAPQEQVFLLGLRDRIIPFPIMGAFLLFLVIGGMVSLLFRYYIIPIMRVAESTQLIALANPNHRVPEIGAREVAHLARIINASADAYQKLQQEVEATIHDARADLLEERNRLAVLMSELPVGVLVCNIHENAAGASALRRVDNESGYLYMEYATDLLQEFASINDDTLSNALQYLQKEAKEIM